MSDEVKRGQVFFTGEQPMQLTEADHDDTSALTADQERTIRLVGKPVQDYLKAAKSLLAQKYSHLKDLAPQHLVDPGNVLVACCPGGAVIRYERKVQSSAASSKLIAA